MNLQGTRAWQVVDVDVIRVAVCTRTRNIVRSCLYRACGVCTFARQRIRERVPPAYFGVGAFARD